MNEKKEIHAGHRERLRQRIIQYGLESLQPHEILEFLLSYPIPRQNTNPIAHALLNRFGDLKSVLSASADELREIPGVGSRTALWITLIGETVRNFRSLSPNDRIRISRPRDVFSYAMQLQRRLHPPCTLQICLDSGGYLQLQRQLTPSCAWGEKECLRQAVRDMMDTEAIYSIVILFIPPNSGQMDEYDTQHAHTYAQTLSHLGCTLLDVIVVSEMEIVSLREQGRLPTFSGTKSISVLRENYEDQLCEYACLRSGAPEEKMNTDMEEEYERIEPV